MFDRIRGSSSVIGVILMVAVTVILAAIVGVYGMGFAENPRNPAQITLSGGQENLAGSDETQAYIEYTVEAGESLPKEQITVLVDGVEASNADVQVSYSEDTLGAGDTITITQNDKTDLIGTEEIHILYDAPDSSETSLLESKTVETGGPAKQVPEFTFEPFSTGTNPGTPWSTDEGASGTVKVSNNQASEGSNSVYISTTDGGGSYAELSVDVDLTHVETIRFAYYNNSGEANDMAVKIDGSTIQRMSSGSGWQTDLY